MSGIFSSNDIEENCLNSGGTIALEFNEEPSIGFYTMELRKYFESRSARIFRGRVIMSRGNPRSQSSPTAGPHRCNGRRSLGARARLVAESMACAIPVFKFCHLMRDRNP
jgi:hypothetical protein